MKKRILSFGSLSSPLAKGQTQAVIDRILGENTRLVCQLSVFPSPVAARENRDEVFHAASQEELVFLADQLRHEQCRLVVVEAADLAQPLPEDLDVLAIPDRVNPFDAFLNRQGLIMDEMDPGSRIGVLSARSRAQMTALWPDLEFQMLPGGVDQAMEIHMRRSEIDGLVLPAAVTELLGIQGIVAEIFSPEFILPGPGQGIFLVVGLANDEEARSDLAAIHSKATAHEFTAEMAFRRRMISDRDVPVGALARVRGRKLSIVGGTGNAANRISVDGNLDQAEIIGDGLANQILQSVSSFADLLEAEFPDGLPDVGLDEGPDEDLDDGVDDGLPPEFEEMMEEATEDDDFNDRDF